MRARGERRIVRDDARSSCRGSGSASSMSSNTPPAVWRSRLPVGSSASTQAGRVTSARASAARCRSPPESCPGGGRAARRAPLRAGSPRPARRASARGMPPDAAAASRRSRAPRTPSAGDGTGTRSRAPRCAGARARRRRATLIGRPRTSTSPAVGSSRPPSRWSSVLLPEPDAPTIATTSPGRDRQVHAEQHLHRHARLAVGLRQPAAREHGPSGPAHS